MTRLRESRILITGAGSGIGRLLALGSADLGAHVILWDKDRAALEEVQAQIAEKSARASSYCCDLRDPESIRSAGAEVLRELGAVDIIVNNAGVVTGKSIVDGTDEETLQTLSVNLLAPIRIIRFFLPSMIQRDQGHIVNISSAAGIMASARLSDYAATKFGLFGFDESLRIELQRMGSQVRTTVVCPFYVDTGMFSGVTSRASWLLPILEPEQVAARILRAVERDRRRLVMPWFVYAGWPLRLLPTGILDRLLDVFGISRSMDGFVGRSL